MSAQPKWYAYTIFGAAQQDSDEDLPLSLPRRAVSRRFVWLEISLAILIMALSLLTLVEPASAQSKSEVAGESYRAYLPMLSTASVKSANAEPTCDLLPEERAIADAMSAHSMQGRSTLHCNPILAQVARDRAKDMGLRGYFDHVDPDGYGPNYLVTQAGYVLPDWYSQADSANNLESIGAGYRDSDGVWDAWMGSPHHQAHLLGLNSFYASQIEFGIGYAHVENSRYGYYWVVITAPR